MEGVRGVGGKHYFSFKDFVAQECSLLSITQHVFHKQCLFFF